MGRQANEGSSLCRWLFWGKQNLPWFHKETAMALAYHLTGPVVQLLISPAMHAHRGPEHTETRRAGPRERSPINLEVSRLRLGALSLRLCLITMSPLYSIGKLEDTMLTRLVDCFAVSRFVPAASNYRLQLVPPTNAYIIFDTVYI